MSSAYNATFFFLSVSYIWLLNTSAVAFTTHSSPRPERLPVYQQGRMTSWSSVASAKTGTIRDGRPLSQPNVIRGERYKNENSTLPEPAFVAKRLGVKPTKEASARTWQRAWRIHKRLIPLLHSTDTCNPSDKSLNIACMWWKALSGNDKTSPVYDNKLAYDLLPSGWRRIVRLRRLYPRLHHGNVELRTAYLDDQVAKIIKEVKKASSDNFDNSSKNKKIFIRLICMGAGYDTRGIKMLERNVVDEVVELDLPEVVNSKKLLFKRLIKRRPWLQNIVMPTLISSDFNDVSDVKQKLDVVLKGGEEKNEGSSMIEKRWHTIFVFEGVLIYLNDGVPSSLLDITSSVLRQTNNSGTLCFADRLENVPGGDFDLGLKELQNNGWTVRDWCPKPGLARHMGSANLA